MNKLKVENLENIKGGNCFLAAFSLITGVGAAYAIIDALDGDSYLVNCYN